LIIVLERACLVWKSLAAKFTECTWSLELGGKLNSLSIKTQFFERLQSVSVVGGATHTQKDDVESNGGSLENVAEISATISPQPASLLPSPLLPPLSISLTLPYPPPPPPLPHIKFFSLPTTPPPPLLLPPIHSRKALF
jgi:hypothetical protein